ncbi:MAG: ROK family protein [Clostridia bacterium]|nr:ROK family protein [Clostridia bacterium]
MLTTKYLKKYYGGIDLGGTFIKCGIVDEEGNILTKDKIPTGVSRYYREVIEDMANLIKKLAKEANVKIESVGVGSPGMIDSANGIVVYSNNFSWQNVPLKAELEKYLNVPVRVTNDANAAALGESFCGAGKKYRSMVLVTLGTGVGSGIVLDGKLYEGNGSAGAELGHMVIHTGGEKCTCGRHGCFEAYASATALIRFTRSAMKVHNESVMWKLCDGNPEAVDGKTAFDGMRQGDETAKNVVKNYISNLAAGIVNIANIFRPEIILIGGGICKENEALLKPLREIMSKELFGGEGNVPVELGVATLGNDAGICGAAKLNI